MKKNVINTFLITLLLASSGILIAGSNNGYTTAANVYSGSSSQGWYGGGVQYWLAKWQQEKIAPAAAESIQTKLCLYQLKKSSFLQSLWLWIPTQASSKVNALPLTV